MVLLIARALFAADAPAPQNAGAGNLRVEYLVNPIDIDVPLPRLSWEMVSDQRGQKQTAYEILAATTTDSLTADKGDLWDSGKVLSDATAQIPYGGKALSSRQQVFWKVRIWDRDGKALPWSESANWTMGLLNAADWTGRWIGTAAASATTAPAGPAAGQATGQAAGPQTGRPPAQPADDNHPRPIFRKEFTVATPLKRATIYICGLGQFELRLNGAKVGEDILSPGWTNYRKTCLYVAYDITSQIRPGQNALGVMLGDGMYNVVANRARYTKFIGSFGPLRLIAELHLDYADGTSQEIATDASWKTSPGPITFSGIYGGEDYDARLEQPGWDQPRFSDSAWAPSTVMDGPGGALAGSSKSAPPIRVAEVLKPKGVTQAGTGWVYDMGQNCADPEDYRQRPGGVRVKILPGEILGKNGAVSQPLSRNQAYYDYTLNGNAAGETWSPAIFLLRIALSASGWRGAGGRGEPFGLTGGAGTDRAVYYQFIAGRGRFCLLE